MVLLLHWIHVYGLNDAKMQILQMISDFKSIGSRTAIAIKGPPGTGKTSLIKEGISKILGRILHSLLSVAQVIVVS